MTEHKSQSFVVLLHNEPVAQLRAREDGSSTLRFFDSYVQAVPRSVLSQKFEDWNLSRIRRFQALPPFFQHLLPEGALRKYILRAEQIVDSDVELLRRLGRDLPGAVTLVPEDAADDDVPAQVVEEPPAPPAAPPGKLRASWAKRSRVISVKHVTPTTDLLQIVDETIERARDVFSTSVREWPLTAEERAQLEAHWRQVPLLRRL